MTDKGLGLCESSGRYRLNLQETRYQDVAYSSNSTIGSKTSTSVLAVSETTNVNSYKLYSMYGVTL